MKIKIARILLCSCPIFLSGSLAAVDKACAHSVGDCVDHVVSVCNAQYPNNYQARIACTDAGITACETHGHGGGGGIEPGSNDFSIEDNDVSNEEDEPGSLANPQRVQPNSQRQRVAPNR